MHQNRSHHHHGTAEGSFTAKKWFGHRAGRSPCAHSIGKFFLCYIVLFSSETSAPGSPGNYLYNTYMIYVYVYIYIHRHRHFLRWNGAPFLMIYFSSCEITSRCFPRAKSCTSAAWVLWFDFLVPWLGLGGVEVEMMEAANFLGEGAHLGIWNLIDGLGTWWFTISASFGGLRIVFLFVVFVLFSLHFDAFLVVEKRGLVFHNSMNSWWFGLVSSRTFSSSALHLSLSLYIQYIV